MTKTQQQKTEAYDQYWRMDRPVARLSIFTWGNETTPLGIRAANTIEAQAFWSSVAYRRPPKYSVETY